MVYTVVNLITFILGMLFLANGYYLVRSGREKIAVFVMSGLVGVGLIIVALVPNIFEIVAAILGLELKARAILVIANLTLFVIATYLFNRIGHLHRKISRLNEELSLLRAETERSNDER